MPIIAFTESSREMFEKAKIMNGKFRIIMKMGKGSPERTELNIETPVIPPSINLLGNRNDFRPKVAERTPKINEPNFKMFFFIVLNE
jgi:hypothetical protein